MADAVPASLNSGLRGALGQPHERASAPRRNKEEWRGLLESLQSGGWTPHEELQYTVEISENDSLVVSRLTSPDLPSAQMIDLYTSLHGRMASLLPNASRDCAAEDRAPN